jgi:hypothetical protein
MTVSRGGPLVNFGRLAAPIPRQSGVVRFPGPRRIRTRYAMRQTRASALPRAGSPARSPNSKRPPLSRTARTGSRRRTRQQIQPEAEEGQRQKTVQRMNGQPARQAEHAQIDHAHYAYQQRHCLPFVLAIPLLWRYVSPFIVGFAVVAIGNFGRTAHPTASPGFRCRHRRQRRLH